MKTAQLTAVALLVATLGSGYAVAADSATHSVTRAQVLAELAEAKRTGDLFDTKSGKKLNELYPQLYPAKPATQSVSREQVINEYIEAKRNGDLVDTKSGKKLNELYPQLYPTKS